MRVAELTKDLPLTFPKGNAAEILSMRVTGVTSDSRCVRPGMLFLCVKGTKTDGMAYLPEAIARGAALCVCEDGDEPPDDRLPVIGTPNARRALSFMLSRWYGSPAERMKLIGVTGTNGKTSTCAMLDAIFSHAGKKTGTVGTLKSHIGTERLSLGRDGDERMSTMTTPDPEQLYPILSRMAEDGVEYVIMEASSHALQLEKLAPIRFQSAIFTNFSPEHLDFHRSMADYLSAKERIYRMSRTVYYNRDDENCRRTAESAGIPCVSFGVSASDADYRAMAVSDHGIDGVSYVLDSKDATFRVRSVIPGAFTVYNSLAAAALSYGEGICPSVIAAALRSLTGVEGRLERIRLPREYADFSVFIDYAHTEKAMENLLRTVVSFRQTGQRIVTLFGCGGERDKSKRAPMGRVASRYSDFVILTEDNSRSEDPDAILSDILWGIDRTKPYQVIRNRKSAIEYAIGTALPGDILLLVGKGHEQYEITAEGKIPFSEKEIVLSAIEMRRQKTGK